MTRWAYFQDTGVRDVGYRAGLGQDC